MNNQLQKIANRIARRNGHNTATAIIIGNDNIVVKSTPAGYRKKATGEYVSSAYHKKAWSSCFYQHAECVVSLTIETIERHRG